MPKDRRLDRHRDRPHWPDTSPGLTPCAQCGDWVGYSGYGHRRTYCSAACKQAAWRARTRAPAERGLSDEGSAAPEPVRRGKR